MSLKLVIKFYHLKEENGLRIIELSKMSDRKKLKVMEPETDDLIRLRDMINESNQQIDSKRTIMDGLKQSNNELNQHLTVTIFQKIF